MNKKKLLRILFVVMIIILNLIIFWKIDFSDIDTKGVTFVVRMAANKDDTYQIYYSKSGGDFEEVNSASEDYVGFGDGTKVTTIEGVKITDGADNIIEEAVVVGEEQEIRFDFPMEFDNLRFDFGQFAGNTVIYDMYFEMSGVKYQIPFTQLQMEENAPSIISRTIASRDSDQCLIVNAEAGDPNMLIQFHKDELLNQYKEANAQKKMILDIALCVVMDFIAIYVLLHFFSLIEIPVEIYQNRKLALTLAKNDFKTKYAGSYLGMLWAFIQPIVTILVYWFVFTVGLKAGKVGEYPFVLFIVVGIIPWFFFSDSLNGGTNAMTDYNYLVKKVVFNIDILPFVKVLSAFFVHCFFIAFALILCTCMGYHPTIYTLQLIYYIFCNFVFVLGLSYLTSAIVVFFRDLGQFINIFILQVGVWLTPIMWNANTMLSPLVLKIFKLNPMYYIVSGFRDSVLDKNWFWMGDRLLWTIYFWIITILVFGLGVKIFRRLKVHFADVL